jgi:hypothetical protein
MHGTVTSVTKAAWAGRTLQQPTALAKCPSMGRKGHRRPPESAPEADRSESAPHAGALGRVLLSLTVQVPMRLPVPGPLLVVRPAVRRHGVLLCLCTW